MPVNFNAIPADLEVPFHFVEFRGSAENVQTEQRGPALLMMQMQEATSVSGVTVKAGSATPNVPVRVINPADADALFGEDSMAAQAVHAYRDIDPTGELWVIPLADASGGSSARATGTFTYTLSPTTLTKSGTLYHYIGSVLVKVGVVVGDDADAITARVTAAINATAGLSVVAVNTGSGVVTLHARHVGDQGNKIPLAMNLRGAHRGEVLPAQVAVAVAAMSGGATDPTVTTAVGAMGDELYDVVAVPYNDALTAVNTEVLDRWEWDRGIDGHIVSLACDTVSQLITDVGALDTPAQSIFGYKDFAITPWRLLAMTAAAIRLRMSADPARPFNRYRLSGVIPPPRGSSGRFSVTERDALIKAGCATYAVIGDNVFIETFRTNYHTNAQGSPDKTWRFGQNRFVDMFSRRYITAVIEAKFGDKKIVEDGTPVRPGTNTVTPAVIRAEYISCAVELVGRGWWQGLESFKERLVVEIDESNGNRVNAKLSPKRAGQLRTMATVIEPRV